MQVRVSKSPSDDGRVAVGGDSRFSEEQGREVGERDRVEKRLLPGLRAGRPRSPETAWARCLRQ
jgi:hypothetical protein